MALDTDLVIKLCVCSVLVLAVWAAFLGLTYIITLYDAKDGKVLGAPSIAQRMEAADVLFSIPFYVLMVALAMWATYDLCGDVTTRWHGVTPASFYFMLLYVTRMTTHMPIQWVVLQSDPKLRLQMTAHHLLSVFCFGNALVTTRMHFWANFDGCCEFSTVFLNMVFGFKWVFPKDPPTCFIAQSLTGVMLWIGFVVFRLILFPMWLWMFYQDITTDPEESWDTVTTMERFLYPSVTLFLLVLSTIWFVPITKGLLKALGLAGKGKDESTAYKPQENGGVSGAGVGGDYSAVGLEEGGKVKG